MRFLQFILTAIDTLNRWIARIVSWAVVVIMAATLYEVVMRYVFNAPTNWVFEFNYLLHGPYFLLLGAYTFAVNGHVNVDIIYSKLPLRLRAAADIITMPILLYFLFVMLLSGIQFAANSFAYRETLSSAWGPPIYPVKMVIPVAALLFILQAAARLIRDIHVLITGKSGVL